MKRALITGSEGFAGGHLWGELEKNGYEVFGTTLQFRDTDIKKKVFQCDITVKEDLKKVIGHLLPDYIFNMASQAAPSLSFKKPQLTFLVNTIGTANLLDAVREIPDYHPRILLAGSSDEYGIVSEKDMPVTEEQVLNPQNPYSISKVAAYYLMKVYVKSYQMNIIYASSFNNTGPGQLPGFLAPDVADQIIKIENGKQEPVLLTGNVDTFRDYTDVRDVVRAYRLMLEKGVSGERYNICSGKSISTEKIVETLIKNSTVKINHKVDPLRNRPSDMPAIKGSYQKLQKLTGWEPQLPLEQTLKDLLDWYRNRG